MQQFSPAQLALLAGGLLFQDTLDLRYRQLADRIRSGDLDIGSVTTALDEFYRRLGVAVPWSDLDSASVLAALDGVYRKLGVDIAWADLDSATVLAALDGVYRRLGVAVTWSELDSASVLAALDPRYVAAGASRVRNWSSVVTGTEVELPADPLAQMDPQVYVNGLLNGPAHYTLSGRSLVFTYALDAAEVQVVFMEAAE